MKKMWLKLVSFVMSFVMTITFMPRSMINAVADGVENAGSASEESASAAVGVTEINTDNRTDSYISKELTEKRTEDSKRFLLDDGTIMEQRFAVPVHYLDGENYKEIDNTLEAKTSADGETYYANKANCFTVRLSENMTKNQAVSIEKDGYTIDFIVNDKPNETVRVSKAVLPAETAINSAVTSAANSSANTDTNSVAKIAGTDTVDYNAIRTTEPVQPRTDESVLTYKKVFSGVDFEYSVDSCGLKENIIINRRLSDYVFTFTLATKGLRLTLGAGGEITAYNEDDEAKFVIPAPNMTDADGVYSEDVYYRLAEIDDDKYALGIVASEEWFADPSRAFPVKIDPAVSAGEKKTAKGLTVYEASTIREYNQSRIKFGKVDSKRCDSFMSFPNENNQFYLVGHQLAFSKLKYYVRSVGGNAAGTTEYKVKTAKTLKPLSADMNFGDFDWTNKPVLLSGSIKSTKVLILDATHESRWEEAYFNPEDFADCPDMVFHWTYISLNDNQHGEVDVRSGNLPSVLNYYVPTVGIKDDLPYEQVKYNGGGAAVNLVSGALTATFNALSIDVAENPISLQLVYNDGYDDIMTEFGMHKMFGKDFKLNFQQALRIDGRSVRYIDEDGSIDTLGQTLGTYYSVDKNMTYTTDGHSLYIGTRTRVSFSGTQLYKYYDASDIYAEKLMYEIFYSGNKITQIAGYTNGNKTHYVSFTYNGDDRVSSARSYVSEYVGGGNFSLLSRCDFVYNSDGRLIEIVNGNSDNVKFTLNYENNLLRGLTDFDGYGYIFNRAASTSRVSLVNTTYGESISSGNYFSNFDGYTRYWLRSNNSATLEYYVNGKYEGDRNVTRSFGKGFRSEWTVDDQEEETIISTSVADMTGATDRSYLTYTTSDYVTKEKDNTSLVDEAALAAGNSLNGTISENHGVVSKTGRQYCLSLKISSLGSTFVEVYVAGTKRGTIGISDTTVAYYIIPVSYYQQSGTTAIKIKNVGNNDITVSNVSYNYYTSVKKTKRIETYTIINYVTQTESVSLDSKQTTTYDYFGRPLQVTDVDYKVSPSETKTYTYTYASGGSEFNCNRLESVSDGTKSVEYSYDAPASDERRTTVLTRNGSVPVTKTVTLTHGSLGDYYVSETRNGVTVKTEYAIKAGNIRPYKVTTGDTVVEYEYNYDGNVTYTSINGVLAQQTSYSIITGKEIGYSIGGLESYTLVRDSSVYGLVTGVNYQGSRMMSFGYNVNGDLNSVTYANGATYEYAYNSNRRIQTVAVRDSSSAPQTTFTFGYRSGELRSVVQSTDGVTQLTHSVAEYENERYDTTISGDVNASFSYYYDEDTGLIKRRTISIGNGSRTRDEYFNFDRHGTLLAVGDVWFKTFYSYDSNDRVASQRYNVGGADRMTLQFEYDTIADGSVTYQTDRIRKITNATTGTNQTYVYNNKGFVSSYKDSKTNDVRHFTYDAAGRLLSDGTYTYAYDSFNNITSKQAGTNATTFSYDSSKKTRLNSVTENGSTKYFVYDAIGNVTTYKGISGSASQNLYWTRGNMLASGNVKGNAFSYKYDLNNLRYSKTVDGVETKYYWDDDVLVGESTGDDYIQYIYDASGIAGMRYNDEFYYFEKNLFGDILRVYGVYGSLAAEFKYDSYGNVTSATGSMANRVKFRYRGYYFDAETGFYYLQSRYYDPTICRFVSADQYELLGTLSQTLGQLNLYAYCNNNPIMYADSDGKFAISIAAIGAVVGALVLAAVGGGLAYHVAKNNGVSGGELFGITFVGGLGGALLGGFLGFGIGTLISKITGVIGLSITKYYILPIKEVTVLGSMPGYIAAAETVGAGYYLISDTLWEQLSTAERWASNLQYLTDAVNLKSSFVIYSERVVNVGSSLWNEILFLIRNGVPWEMF